MFFQRAESTVLLWPHRLLPQRKVPLYRLGKHIMRDEISDNRPLGFPTLFETETLVLSAVQGMVLCLIKKVHLRTLGTPHNWTDP